MLQWIASRLHNSGSARPELLRQTNSWQFHDVMYCIALHLLYSLHFYDVCNKFCPNGNCWNVKIPVTRCLISLSVCVTFHRLHLSILVGFKHVYQQKAILVSFSQHLSAHARRKRTNFVTARRRGKTTSTSAFLIYEVSCATFTQPQGAGQGEADGPQQYLRTEKVSQKTFVSHSVTKDLRRTFGWTFWCALPKALVLSGRAFELFRKLFGAVRAIFWPW